MAACEEGAGWKEGGLVNKGSRPDRSSGLRTLTDFIRKLAAASGGEVGTCLKKMRLYVFIAFVKNISRYGSPSAPARGGAGLDLGAEGWFVFANCSIVNGSAWVGGWRSGGYGVC